MSTPTFPRAVADLDRTGMPWYAASAVTGDVLWLAEPHLKPGLTWADVPAAQASTTATVTELTPDFVRELIFCSPLDPADEIGSEALAKLIDRQLAACGCDPGQCAGQLAQEAGDHPAAARDRMLWCHGLERALAGVSV